MADSPNEEENETFISIYNRINLYLSNRWEMGRNSLCEGKRGTDFIQAAGWKHQHISYACIFWLEFCHGSKNILCNAGAAGGYHGRGT